MEPKTMRNEIISNLDIKEYHAHEGLSNSGLKLILDCPKRYWHEYLDPDKEPVTTPRHFLIGQAVHTLALEPLEFNKRFIVAPDVDRRTKIGKETYAAFQEKANGKMILSDKDNLQAFLMAEALCEHALHKNLFSQGKIEQSFFFEDDGVQVKSRPDWHSDNMWVDVKTTSDMKYFTRDIYKYNYHTQAAMAREAFKKLYKLEYKYFVFLVVEECEPYLTKAFILDDASLELGYREYKRGLEIYKKCVDKNIWPGYGDAIEQVTLPKYLDLQI
jgi:hypothetical protein